MIAETLGKLAAGQDLSADEAAAAVDAIMRGACTPGEIGLFLTGLRLKGESVAEIAGAASAMRSHMTRIRTRREDVLDTCGTGGDGSGTFNISTAAALVAAAAGVAVAKHGNRKITSRSGSADVLQHLGVNVDVDVPRVEQCLDELGICFCFAPRLHPAMRHVADVRRKLGVPTIFNMLGPLTNPAGAAYQMIGVGKPELAPLLAEALQMLGTRRALVVHGEDGLDEVTLAGATHVIEVTPQGRQSWQWQPKDFALQASPLDAIGVSGPEESAAMIRKVLAGERGPARDITVLNAAAALYVSGKSDQPAACAQMAAQAIDSGAASRLLEELAGRTAA